MIGDLLDFASITFGKMRLVAASMDPYAAVRAAIEIMRPASEAKEIELRCEFQPVTLTVEADSERLQQIVWNLVSNAIKFSEAGGTVAVRAGQWGENFELIVTDTGQGIGAEFLPRVFERFSQADATTTRRIGGLGIGLAIVRQLAEMQGGTIEAHSAGKGRGATFTLRLPLTSDRSGDLSDSQRLRALGLGGTGVLLGEDDGDAPELTRRILSDAGAKVVEAASASEALKRVNDSKVNFLVSDIGMAEEDGYQLLRRVRAGGFSAVRLPAIALTAFARPEDRE